MLTLGVVLMFCCTAMAAVVIYTDVENYFWLQAVQNLPPQQAQLLLQINEMLLRQQELLVGVFVLPVKVLLIALMFVVAVAIHSMAWNIAGWMLNSRLWNQLFVWSSHGLRVTGIKVETPQMRAERQRTIQLLMASSISITVFFTVVMLSLAQFLDAGALAVITGLLSAGFGFGARTLIGDLLAGISNIFEDNFDVGEKVEIAYVSATVEGVVESVNLRTTSIRAPTGELLIIPNGEIRMLRNYSRGRFSTANVKLKILTTDLPRALNLLRDMSKDAVAELPNLLEPWQVISEEGAMGEHTELTLLVKARFGQAATLRPNLLALVQKHFQEASITLVD
ncbi:MAG: mechanosensitive ion channel family protein [Anaerolineae bacterium]